MRFFGALAAAAAAALALTGGASAALLPTQDPFYTQPANISKYAPGDVIRTRNITNNISGFFVGNTTEKVKTAWQYLYRTTDSLGKPVAAMTTLLVPYNADPTKLLVYSTAYDSTDNNCVPSYSLQAGGNSTDGADTFFIAASLNKGWYVLTSDYEGLNTELIVGLQSGQAVLDSVRAAFHRTSSSGLSPSAIYSLFGYSGGSVASEWAAELAASYAPELHFEGIAIGGVPVNLTHTLLYINNGPNSELAFAALEGIARAFPNVSQYLDDNLIPSKRAEFESYVVGCMSKPNQGGMNKDLFSFLKNGQRSLYDPVPASVLPATGQMGVHGTPQMPMFIYKAIFDEIVPINDSDALVAKYCSEGVTIEYQKDIIGGHATEGVIGSAKAFAWINDRMNRKPLNQSSKCVTNYVALLSPDAETVAALGDQFVAILESLIGGMLGPSNSTGSANSTQSS